MTHLPFWAWCPVCVDNQARKAQARTKERKHGNVEVDPQKFGDLLLADDIILQDPVSWGSKGETAGLMIKDVGAGYRDLMPMVSKSAEDHDAAFLEFVGKRHGH